MAAFNTSWKHMRRSPYQAFAAISIMALTFIVGGLFVLLTIGSTTILKYFEQKPQIIVFFKDTKHEEDIKALEIRLKQMEQVAGTKYVSKDEALGIYKEQFKKDPLLLEMVSADILPASLEVSATKIEYLPSLASTLAKETDVEDIVFPEDVVNMLVSWTSTVRYIGLVVVVFLSLVSLFTVFTVISMKIALKRREIEILQLVGATKGYIRKPFLLEGMMYGMLGAMCGGIINIGLLLYATPTLSTILVGIPLFPIPTLFYAIFTFGLLGVGFLLGLLASTLAINRYLH